MAISFPIVFLIAAALFFASSASAPRVNIISFVFAGKTANHGNAAIVPTLDVAMSSARQRYPSMFGSAVWISKAAPFNGSNIAPCDISEDAAIAESLAELYESGSLGRNLSTAGLTVLLTPACLRAFSILGDFARELDILAISCATYAVQLSDKIRFPSVLSFGLLSIDQVTNALSSLLDHYSWRSIVVITDTLSGSADLRQRYTSMCGQSLIMLQNRVDTIQSLRIPIDSDQKGFDWKYILWKIGNYSRVVWICTSTQAQRGLLAAATANGYANGDYVFLSPYIGYVPNDLPITWNLDDSLDSQVLPALQNLLILRHPLVPWKKIRNVTDNILKRRLEYYGEPVETAAYYRENDLSLGCYESVGALAAVVKDTYTALPTFVSGSEFARHFYNNTLALDTRDIRMTSVGSRLNVLEIVQFDVSNKEFKAIFTFDVRGKKITPVPNATLEWKLGVAPLDRPPCGLHGEYCIDRGKRDLLVAAVAGTFVPIVVLSVLVTILVRKHQQEADLMHYWWQILPSDLIRSHTQEKSFRSRHFSLYQYGVPDENKDRLAYMPTYTKYAWTTPFWVQRKSIFEASKPMSMVPNRSFLIYIRKIRGLHSKHVNMLLGVCIGHPCLFVEDYCRKGSVADLIRKNGGHQTIEQHDWDMNFSLLVDLKDALRYLHGSAIKLHGNLKSTKCLLDNYFSLKLSDVGHETMEYLLHKKSHSTFPARQSLWTAPEVLRGGNPSQQADIYAYGIIASEIIMQCGPFNVQTGPVQGQWAHDDITDIINRIRNTEDYIVTRPKIESNIFVKDAEVALVWLLEGCWAENPQERLTIQQLENALHTVMGKLKMKLRGSLFDRLVYRLDTYAGTLQHTVAERTRELELERAHCDTLLLELLPKEILRQLRTGKEVLPQEYESATIYFSTICGFSEVVASSEPLAVIQFLSSVYSAFDLSIATMKVASGLPTRNGTEHVIHICSMALSLQTQFEKSFSSTKSKLRVGINSGPVVAGVVGIKCPRYCLFGDTINTASRMESHGSPSRTHISATTAVIAQEHGFKLNLRGEIEIKGKGKQVTYWLTGSPKAKMKDSARSHGSN